MDFVESMIYQIGMKELMVAISIEEIHATLDGIIGADDVVVFNEN